MDYKKILKSRALRLGILRMLSFVPDKAMLKLQYKAKHGRKLNLGNPERFTEKLQWYKAYYRNEVMHQCVDKYGVREYVASKGLSSILTELYGVYDGVDDIDVSELPERFVVKTTNGGGGLNVHICKDKAAFDKVDVKQKIGQLRRTKKGEGGREWAYIGIEPKIIVEEYLENPQNPEAGVNDYKFLCFGGKPECVWVDVDRHTDHKRSFYDVQWNKMDATCGYPDYDQLIEKPENFERMVEIAAKLSEDFPHVRVDLYNVGGKIYFGELTFYTGSGYEYFSPDEFDYELGKKFVLPEVKG